jgi:cyanophycinase
MRATKFVVQFHAVLCLLLLTGQLAAQAKLPALPEKAARPIAGKLVICGGGAMPDPVRDAFVKLAGGEKARLVIIPTASETADQIKDEVYLKPWQKYNMASIVVLHTRDRDRANDAVFVKPLTEATAVWLGGGSQTKLAEAYLHTAVHKELHALLKRDGVIGGTSAGAAVMSKLMIASGNPKANLGEGFGFLDHFVVDQHFLKRNRMPRLAAVIRQYPQMVGLGIDEETAVLVSGRTIKVLGNSEALACLAASKVRAEKVERLKSGDVADLLALSRAAFARAAPSFPPAKPSLPVVAKGTLIIVGGGGTPPEALKRFFDAAGGKDAPIVFVPTAMEDPIRGEASEVKMFKRYGATNITVVHTRDPEEANKPEFCEAIRKSKGVWFSGGRQWRFADAYLDTLAHKAFLEVLERGGVIGGSSAGASIQADYMARGHPLGNLEIMAEGYERGLGFIQGVAIDQHFFKRNRTADMTRLVDFFPQLLGIGIDEATAIIVHGEVMEVVGKSKVAVYDRTRKVEKGQPDYQTLTAGERYNLKERKVIDGAK